MKYAVACMWMVLGTAYVDADSAEDAAAKINETDTLPEDNEYLTDSFRVIEATPIQ